MNHKRFGITLLLICAAVLGSVSSSNATSSVLEPLATGFGYSVALDGDTAMVGAPGIDRAYIFYRNQGGSDVWGGVKSLSPSGLTHAGGTVAVSGDIAVVGVGAPDEAVNIFYRNLGGLNNWGQ